MIHHITLSQLRTFTPPATQFAPTMNPIWSSRSTAILWIFSSSHLSSMNSLTPSPLPVRTFS